jgi:two-component system phosphate regulon sensor histidine kinase PhoR
MAMALLGVMALQFVWMRKAFIVRNELFDRSVNEAMIRTANRLETLSDVFLVHDIVAPPPPPPPVPLFNQQHTRNLHKNHAPGVQKNFVFKHDTIVNRFQSGNGNQHQIKVVSNTYSDNDQSHVTVRVEQVDSIVNTIEEQIDHNVSVMYSTVDNNHQSDSLVRRHNPDWEQRIGKRVKRLKDVAGKMVIETWGWDTEIVPDAGLIDSILVEELAVRNIPIGFEFAVLRDDSLMKKTNGYDSLHAIRPTYMTQLFPNAIFNKSDRLSIYFPTRNSFLIKSLVLPASLSLLFCLIIMGTFGLSIYYILRQKKVSEMKSDFINNMTHEFKTPLATISVATDSMVNPKVIGNPDQIANYASIIRKENLRMNKQVETILQIASLDRKDFDFKFCTTDIHELIEKAVQGIIFQIENRNGYINIEKQASNPMVTADPVHALNMLNNLLDNANKYSPEIPEITVSTRNSDRGVWISVSDKGIGMSKQVQGKVFEKFYREATGNIHNVKGFGLGLSYVKAVVDANRGEVRVSSEPGKGSTFEVFLPFTLTT